MPAQSQGGGGGKLKMEGGGAQQQALNSVVLADVRTPFPCAYWQNLLLPAHTIPEWIDRNSAARQRRGELESHSHLS